MPRDVEGQGGRSPRQTNNMMMLATALENIPSDFQYDFSAVYVDDGACVRGCAVGLAIHTGMLAGGTVSGFLVAGQRTFCFQELHEEFGLDPEQVLSLFGTGVDYVHVGGPTPRNIAARLRVVARGADTGYADRPPHFGGRSPAEVDTMRRVVRAPRPQERRQAVTSKGWPGNMRDDVALQTAWNLRGVWETRIAVEASRQLREWRVPPSEIVVRRDRTGICVLDGV